MSRSCDSLTEYGDDSKLFLAINEIILLENAC